MEDIPGYDDWKSTPPDDPEPVTYCSGCGAPLYEGDYLYTVQPRNVTHKHSPSVIYCTRCCITAREPGSGGKEQHGRTDRIRGLSPVIEL